MNTGGGCGSAGGTEQPAFIHGDVCVGRHVCPLKDPASSRLSSQKKGDDKTSNPRKILKGKRDVDPACLRRELETYRKNGVSLDLEGCPSNPYEIVRAHLIAETGGYMRDYMHDEKGEIRKIGFDKVRF